MSEQNATALPPNSQAAEKALLGIMLRWNDIIPEVVGMVRAEDFYTYGHVKIFEAITALADKGKQTDLVSVGEWLLREGKAVDAGGMEYLAELHSDAPPTSFRQHAEAIRDYSSRRLLIQAGLEMQKNAFDLGTPAEELVSDAERKVMEISGLGFRGEAVELHQAISEAYHRLDQRRGRSDGEISGVPTGFLDLDTLLCGFQNSELVIIGARPSVGKTMFGLNILRHFAIECEMPVLFVSLEQARVELAERLLCMHGKIDSHRLRRGYISGTDQEDLIAAGDALSKAKVFFDDSPSQNMLRISSNARRLHKQHGIKLVIIDYLQLVVSDLWKASRQEQVADTSRRLKALARELKIPVLVCCQVNRGPEDRTDKRPRLSDLRESGAIECDADTVILLHKADPQSGEMEVIVAKQRNGPTGEVKLMYVPKYMKFENAAMDHQYAKLPA